MPGSILAYGVDFDGDGQVDLRNSPVDAIGSVANFLVQHGWKAGQAGPIAYPANVSPGRAWESFIGQGLEAKFTRRRTGAAGAVTSVGAAGRICCSAWSTCKMARKQQNTGWPPIIFLPSPITIAVIFMPCLLSNWAERCGWRAACKS